MKLFSVSSVAIGATVIAAIISSGNTSESIQVDKSKFEAFLDRQGILSAPIQFHDDEGTCELAFCAMSMDEYYQGHGEVNEDLYNFLLIQNSNRILKDGLDPLNKILSEYKN